MLLLAVIFVILVTDVVTDGSALPPLGQGPRPLPGARGADDERGSQHDLPRDPLGQHGWRARLPGLRLRHVLRVPRPTALQVQGLWQAVQPDLGHDLPRPQAARARLPPGDRIFVNAAKGLSGTARTGGWPSTKRASASSPTVPDLRRRRGSAACGRPVRLARSKPRSRPRPGFQPRGRRSARCPGAGSILAATASRLLGS